MESTQRAMGGRGIWAGGIVLVEDQESDGIQKVRKGKGKEIPKSG